MNWPEWPEERVIRMVLHLNDRTGYIQSSGQRAPQRWQIDYAVTGPRFRLFPDPPDDAFHLCIYADGHQWFIDKDGCTVVQHDAPGEVKETFDEQIDAMMDAFDLWRKR